MPDGYDFASGTQSLAGTVMNDDEIGWRLMGNKQLISLFRYGFPIEELERRLAGSLALAEAFGKTAFYAQRAAKDPDYWLDLLQSRINWWPPRYEAPAIEKLEDAGEVPFDDLKKAQARLHPRTAEALRQSALAVYDQIESKLKEYRGLRPSLPET